MVSSLVGHVDNKLTRGRLGSYGGEDSPLDISRVSPSPRLLFVVVLACPLAQSSGRMCSPQRVLRHAGPVRGRGRRAASPETVRKVQHQDDVVHSRCVEPLSRRVAPEVENVNDRSLGHSLETFPEQMAAVRDAGHEM